MRGSLPNFSNINIATLSTNLKQRLDDAKNRICILLKENKIDIRFINELEDLGQELSCFWNPVEALNACKASPELSKEYEKCILELTRFYNWMLHNQELYTVIKSLSNKTTQSKQLKRIIDIHLRDFHLAGVDLDKQKQVLFNQQQERLSLLAHQFEENIRLAGERFTLEIDDDKLLSGIPKNTLQICADQQTNKVILTLDAPIYLSVMQYADNRELRKKIYYAYVTRASELDKCEYDNTALIPDILTLKRKQAELIGFDDFCDYSLATKMANTKSEVFCFLENLARDVKAKAQAELDELIQFAKKNGCETLEAYDIAYYSEKLKLEKIHIDNEKIRQYFPLDKVINGLFSLVEKLFGLRFEAVTEFDRYTPNLELFAIFDTNNNLIGHLFTDFYMRKGKRGGAWMADCFSRHRYKDGELQLPVAFLNCNFNPPHNDKIPTITHDDVLTLFHELGHCLHHLLTNIEYSSIAGISNIPWDAVELPSQFLENWAWEWDVVKTISSHVETQQAMPKALFDKLKESQNFQKGLWLLRQLTFAIFDFKLHCDASIKSSSDVQTLLNTVYDQVAVTKTPPYNRFQNSFSHIFAGGYAAGYYSYLWAEVLSADVFSLFAEQGIFNTDLSMKYKNIILGNGGSQEMHDLLRQMLGRDTNHTAFLKQYGIE